MLSRVILVAAIVAVVVSATAVDIRKHWKQVHCDAPAASKLLSFQVYLKFENEDMLRTHTSSAAGAKANRADAATLARMHAKFGPVPQSSIEGTLAYWRRVLHPTPKAVAMSAAWLAPVLPYCRAEWDSYHCTGVPVATAAALFGVKMCTFVEVAKGSTQEYVFAGRAFTNADGSLQRLPAFVHMVSGIAMFNPTLKPIRKMHTRAITAASLRTQKPQDSDANGDWPSPSATGAPIVIDAGLGSGVLQIIALAISCPDGSMAQSPWYSPIQAPTEWCGTTANAYPTKVNIRLATKDGKYNHTVKMAVDTTVCVVAAGAQLRQPYSHLANQVICIFQNVAFPGLTNWTRYELSASQEFSNPPESNFAPTRNFFGGSFQGMPGKWTEVSIINPIMNTPRDIKNLYGVPQDAWVTSSSVAQGVLEFATVGQPLSGFHLSEGDLESFLTMAGVTTADKAKQYVDDHLTIVGDDHGISVHETTLDVEMMMSIAPGAHTTMWNIINGAGQPHESYTGAFTAWGQNITSGSSGLAVLPSVWSISYGGNEWGSLSDRLESYFAMMTASGVTVCAATGDAGAGLAYDDYPFVSYPASSPSLVGAGASALVQTASESKPHTIVCSEADSNVITSGGGFSAQFALPNFQNADVSNYIAAMKTKAQADGTYNASSFAAQYPAGMRAIPDVAAQGAWIVTIVDQQTIALFGTSASSPIAASMITLMNDKRVKAGMSTLSMTHQLLYAQKATFTDITEGSNCAGEQNDFVDNFLTYPSNQCYWAASGWDAVSGLGAVGYPALEAAALKFAASTSAPTTMPKFQRQA